MSRKLDDLLTQSKERHKSRRDKEMERLENLLLLSQLRKGVLKRCRYCKTPHGAKMAMCEVCQEDRTLRMREQSKIVRMVNRELLSDNYLRRLLVKKGYPKDSIPQDLIDSTRAILATKRVLKHKNTNNNDYICKQLERVSSSVQREFVWAANW